MEKIVKEMTHVEYINKFKEIFSNIIDKEGNPKLCGREACKELIKLANKISEKEEEVKIDFGNENTGIMNVKALVNLYKFLN